MKELIKSSLNLSVLIFAYLVARTAGWFDGRGIDLPWFVDAAFWATFLMLIVLYEVADRK